MQLAVQLSNGPCAPKRTRNQGGKSLKRKSNVIGNCEIKQVSSMQVFFADFGGSLFFLNRNIYFQTKTYGGLFINLHFTFSERQFIPRITIKRSAINDFGQNNF